MEQHLVIRLVSTPGRAEWLPVDGSGHPLGLVQSGALDQAAGMLGERRARVVVPAETMLITHVQLPAGGHPEQWRKAVPFALEDRITEDVEGLHFALGKPGAGGVPVVVVARARMDAWIDALEEAGIEPASIVPDCLALPWSDGEVCFAPDDGRVLCRDGACSGYTTDAETFPQLYAARERERDSGMIPVLMYAEQPPVDDRLPSAPRRERMESGLTAALAPVAIAPPVDLLQGDYARHRGRIELGPWKLPAALAAAFIALVLGDWVAGFVSLEREHRALQSGIEREFRRLVPDEPMSNPRIQVERRLPGSRDTGEWLHMLDALTEAATGDEVRIRSVNWTPGSMEVSFTAADAGQLDTLRSRIASRGLDARVESATSRGGRVEGRMRIGSGG